MNIAEQILKQMVDEEFGWFDLQPNDDGTGGYAILDGRVQLTPEQHKYLLELGGGPR